MIVEKAGYCITAGTPDYNIHGTAVSLCKDENKLSKIVQKTLENKYRRETALFADLVTEQEVRRHWKEALDSGNIPGAYWAVMTHPLSSQALLAEAFGEVHMLSHINGSSGRGNIQRVHYLEGLVEELKAEKNIYKNRIKNLEHRIDFLANALREDESRTKLIESYEEELMKFKNGETYGILFDELFNAVNMYETEKYNREKIEKQRDELEKNIFSLEKENSRVLDEKRSLENRVLYLQAEFQSIARQDEGDCDCSACDADECPCRSLQGKTVLYVGGRASVISHCRALIEKNGGLFLHHDGGIDDNFSLLPESIGRADSVFCPVDCVSHNASRLIKRICNRKNKRYVILKSSGVGVFASEIRKHYS